MTFTWIVPTFLVIILRFQSGGKFDNTVNYQDLTSTLKITELREVSIDSSSPVSLKGMDLECLTSCSTNKSTDSRSSANLNCKFGPVLGLIIFDCPNRFQSLDEPGRAGKQSRLRFEGRKQSRVETDSRGFR